MGNESPLRTDGARTGRALIRRFTALLATAGMVLVMALMNSAPAQAGWKDGDVTNRLPPNYTVKIATFVGGAPPPPCQTWVHGPAAEYPCIHWWLPSGKADDEIRGRDFDTDGFMVESNYYVQLLQGGWSVPAGKWTRIRDYINVECRLKSGRVVCYVR